MAGGDTAAAGVFAVGFRVVPRGVGSRLRGQQFQLALVRGCLRPARPGLLDPGLQSLERGQRDGEDGGQRQRPGAWRSGVAGGLRLAQSVAAQSRRHRVRRGWCVRHGGRVEGADSNSAAVGGRVVLVSVEGWQRGHGRGWWGADPGHLEHVVRAVVVGHAPSSPGDCR
ncbi:hypothetical protein SAM9427_36345 (plasmid) [Streptomyces sp. ETH9427]|nr:hypothetical protein SAM9427_36345 [Streptomyces sp. ETH9427]